MVLHAYGAQEAQVEQAIPNTRIMHIIATVRSTPIRASSTRAPLVLHGYGAEAGRAAHGGGVPLDVVPEQLGHGVDGCDQVVQSSDAEATAVCIQTGCRRYYYNVISTL